MVEKERRKYGEIEESSCKKRQKRYLLEAKHSKWGCRGEYCHTIIIWLLFTFPDFIHLVIYSFNKHFLRVY